MDPILDNYKDGKLLAIESSCDESAAALFDIQGDSVNLICEKVSTQLDLHKLYGGVVPELASREHLSNLPLVIDQVFKEAGCSYSDLVAIMVTTGPGLKGCLLVGTQMALGIGCMVNATIFGVNHIEGHLFSPFICTDRENPPAEPPFPFLALLVSGGHTELVKVDNYGSYEIVSRTLDDAAGEAFDKSANLIGIEYPGGPVLAKIADEYRQQYGDKPPFELPIAMRGQKEFSFSGLKTAISLLIKKTCGPTASQAIEPNLQAQLACSIQHAIVESLMYKVKEAIGTTGIKSLVVSGGVAANQYLRQRLATLPEVRTYFPEKKFCMDNAAMIGHAAAKLWKYSPKSLDYNLEIRPSWPIEVKPEALK